MAQRQSSNGPWIIAGSIVLAGLMIIIAMALLFGGKNGGESASPSPSMGRHSPVKSHSPRPHRSPKPTESPSPSLSPSPSPSPTVDATVLLRTAVAKQAARDRPGEQTHIGQVEFYTDNAGCPQTGQAASTLVRFASQPRVGIYIFCKARAYWKYADGPIYGE
jgi:hypothetical protein